MVIQFVTTGIDRAQMVAEFLVLIVEFFQLYICTTRLFLGTTGYVGPT